MDGNKEHCPAPVTHALHFHFLFQSASFEDEELPSVIGGKIIKAGSCRIMSLQLLQGSCSGSLVHPVGGKDCLKNVLTVFKCDVHFEYLSRFIQMNSLGCANERKQFLSITFGSFLLQLLFVHISISVQNFEC